MKLLLVLSLLLVALGRGDAKVGGKKQEAPAHNRVSIDCSPDASTSICENFARASGHGLNEQILSFLEARYEYESMSKHCESEDVAYGGFAKFFRDVASKKKEDAEEMIEYLQERGVLLHLKRVKKPKLPWRSPMRGLRDALAIEVKIKDFLLETRKVAEEKGDPHLQNFLDKPIGDQVDFIKKLSDYITVVKKIKDDPVAMEIFDREFAEGKR